MDKLTNEVTKQLLINVPSRVAYNILRGKQKLLLRKQIPHKFVGWVNLYVGDKAPYLIIEKDKVMLYERWYGEKLNHKVILKFWYNDYVKIRKDLTNDVYTQYDLLHLTCSSFEEIQSMKKDEALYAWYLRDIRVFNKPKNLQDYKYLLKQDMIKVEKAPKHYLFVWES